MMARDTVALMDALSNEHADILGISMGGRIALELTLTHPSRLRRLVLVSTSAAEPGKGPHVLADAPDVAAAVDPRDAPQVPASRGYTHHRQRDAAVSYEHHRAAGPDQGPHADPARTARQVCPRRWPNTFTPASPDRSCR